MNSTNRLTFDLDLKRIPLRTMISVFYAIQYSRRCLILPTKNGFHVTILLKHSIKQSEIFRIREYFGDDDFRMLFDMVNFRCHRDSKRINRLFDSKKTVNRRIELK